MKKNLNGMQRHHIPVLMRTLLLCLASSIASLGEATAQPSSKGQVVADHGLPSKDDCVKLYQRGSSLVSAGAYRQAQDTLKKFIYECHDLKGSFHGFIDLNAAVQQVSFDTGRWKPYREWLKSVLYLNTHDPDYFCYAATSIGVTFQFNGKERGNDLAASLSIVKYLIESGKCSQMDEELRKRYHEGRQSQYQLWRDTVYVDTSLYPFDSTLPSLEQMGLEILRGQPSAVIAPAGRSGSLVLGAVTSSGNPVGKEAVLSIALTDDATLTLDVFDELGRVVYSSGGFFKSGSVTLTVPGEVLPSGLLYARIMTSQGEVKTVKLLKR